MEREVVEGVARGGGALVSVEDGLDDGGRRAEIARGVERPTAEGAGDARGVGVAVEGGEPGGLRSHLREHPVERQVAARVGDVCGRRSVLASVSYTHLTLPTKA